MRVLFIGGTGNISTSVSRLAVERGIELYLLNRAVCVVPGSQHDFDRLLFPGGLL